MRVILGLLVSGVLIGCLTPPGSFGQTRAVKPGARRSAGDRIHYDLPWRRNVSIPLGKTYSVVVVQFYHQGEIKADGPNVIVLAGGQKPVASKILQLGPGDACRLAFETASGQSSYEILYGGDPLPAGASPAWSNTDGLLLETREFATCNLHRFEEIRKRFESARPIGSDYVDGVHHSRNLFALTPAPFFSRYSGNLHIPNDATYGFITSSQDCSFVLIDGKVVTESPGMHHPRGIATRGSRSDVKLSAGVHKFEYYHAAGGPNAMMVLVWEIDPQDPKPAKPVAIPADCFHAQLVGVLPVGGLSSVKGDHPQPDFLLNSIGDIPLPDNDVPLVIVQFQDNSLKALQAGAAYHWDFGDGQTSEKQSPGHVYLHPGIFEVKLSIRRQGAKTIETTHHVAVAPAVVMDRRQFQYIDEYIPLLRTYEANKLDGASAMQLAAAFDAKAQWTLSPPEELIEDRHGKRTLRPKDSPRAAHKGQAKEKEKDRDKHLKLDNPEHDKTFTIDPQQYQQVKAEARQYVEAAVTVGKQVLLQESAAKGDEPIARLIRLVGPMARDQLGDSKLAGSLWLAAARRISDPELKAGCEVEAAAIMVNDLASHEKAKPLLDAAAACQGKGKKGPLASRIARTWGDYYALAGNGEAARKAYLEAEDLLGSPRNQIQRTAWQGARGRSTEQFLRSGELDRAISEIHAWEEEFPADKIIGYVTLMQARYWMGRAKYPQAVALGQQLSTVNPDSAYVDQILIISAQGKEKMGQTEAAIATLQSLLKSQPGSPLVPEIKERLARLQRPGDAAKEDQQAKSKDKKKAAGKKTAAGE